jgi:hypothetical protein
MTGGVAPPPPTQLPLASRARPDAHGDGGDPTGTQAPLESRNSPLAQAGCRLMHDMPSSLMKRLLQQLPSGIRVYPGAQAGVVGVKTGQCERSVALTATAQHTPPLVTFAEAQHFPSVVGMRPAPQHRGPIGMRMGGLHCALFGPLGTWPLGQHVPVDVILVARQHELPAGT